MSTNDNKTTLVAGVAVAAAATAVVATTGLLGKGGDAGPISAADAARFLTQCTFGVTDADIAAVQSAGYSGWLDQQMAMAPFNMLTAVRRRMATGTPYSTEAHLAFVEQFWQGAITRSDQLRQRMQFALSQIFVVTRETEELEFNGSFPTTHWYDLLANNAFGNWRSLIETLTLNPITGIFLSYRNNDKEDPVSGRSPDENYAREIMQLFSIGTIKLNQDGTPQLDASGHTIPTYSHDDIVGLARVFTGISDFVPDGPTEYNWEFGSAYIYFDNADPDTGNPVQMMFYPTHHSTSAKSFLGVTIPASSTSDPAGDLKIALDTLFNHQNTAPYFAKRLIQQFVTSNPSPGYVSRVAAVFANNGSGVRGDLGAVLKAVLLDTEARDTAGAQGNPIFGKLREPMIRVTNWARTFGAVSKRTHYSIGETGAADDLSQGILDAPSVFNFWRATYVPPHTIMGGQNLVVPEFQVVSELTAAAYVNLVQQMVGSGIGTDQVTFSGFDVSSTYAKETAIATDANALVDRTNLLLHYGQMPASLRTKIVAAVNGISVGTATNPLTASALKTALSNRAKLAIALSMVSGEYLVQK